METTKEVTKEKSINEISVELLNTANNLAEKGKLSLAAKLQKIALELIKIKKTK